MNSIQTEKEFIQQIFGNFIEIPQNSDNLSSNVSGQTQNAVQAIENVQKQFGLKVFHTEGKDSVFRLMDLSKIPRNSFHSGLFKSMATVFLRILQHQADTNEKFLSEKKDKLFKLVEDMLPYCEIEEIRAIIYFVLKRIPDSVPAHIQEFFKTNDNYFQDLPHVTKTRFWESDFDFFRKHFFSLYLNPYLKTTSQFLHRLEDEIKSFSGDQTHIPLIFGSQGFNRRTHQQILLQLSEDYFPEGGFHSQNLFSNILTTLRTLSTNSFETEQQKKEAHYQHVMLFDMNNSNLEEDMQKRTNALDNKKSTVFQWFRYELLMALHDSKKFLIPPVYSKNNFLQSSGVPSSAISGHSMWSLLNQKRDDLLFDPLHFVSWWLDAWFSCCRVSPMFQNSQNPQNSEELARELCQRLEDFKNVLSVEMNLRFNEGFAQFFEMDEKRTKEQEDEERARQKTVVKAKNKQISFVFSAKPKEEALPPPPPPVQNPSLSNPAQQPQKDLEKEKKNEQQRMELQKRIDALSGRKWDVRKICQFLGDFSMIIGSQPAKFSFILTTFFLFDQQMENLRLINEQISKNGQNLNEIPEFFSTLDLPSMNDAPKDANSETFSVIDQFMKCFNDKANDSNQNTLKTPTTRSFSSPKTPSNDHIYQISKLKKHIEGEMNKYQRQLKLIVTGKAKPQPQPKKTVPNPNLNQTSSTNAQKKPLSQIPAPQQQQQPQIPAQLPEQKSLEKRPKRPMRAAAENSLKRSFSMQQSENFELEVDPYAFEAEALPNPVVSATQIAPPNSNSNLSGFIVGSHENEDEEDKDYNPLEPKKKKIKTSSAAPQTKQPLAAAIVTNPTAIPISPAVLIPQAQQKKKRLTERKEIEDEIEHLKCQLKFIEMEESIHFLFRCIASSEFSAKFFNFAEKTPSEQREFFRSLNYNSFSVFHNYNNNSNTSSHQNNNFSAEFPILWYILRKSSESFGNYGSYSGNALIPLPSFEESFYDILPKLEWGFFSWMKKANVANISISSFEKLNSDPKFQAKISNFLENLLFVPQKTQNPSNLQVSTQNIVKFEFVIMFMLKCLMKSKFESFQVLFSIFFLHSYTTNSKKDENLRILFTEESFLKHLDYLKLLLQGILEFYSSKEFTECLDLVNSPQNKPEFEKERESNPAEFSDICGAHGVFDNNHEYFNGNNNENNPDMENQENNFENADEVGQNLIENVQASAPKVENEVISNKMEIEKEDLKKEEPAAVVEKPEKVAKTEKRIIILPPKPENSKETTELDKEKPKQNPEKPRLRIKLKFSKNDGSGTEKSIPVGVVAKKEAENDNLIKKDQIPIPKKSEDKAKAKQKLRSQIHEIQRLKDKKPEITVIPVEKPQTAPNPEIIAPVTAKEEDNFTFAMFSSLFEPKASSSSSPVYEKLKKICQFEAFLRKTVFYEFILGFVYCGLLENEMGFYGPTGFENQENAECAAATLMKLKNVREQARSILEKFLHDYQAMTKTRNLMSPSFSEWSFSDAKLLFEQSIQFLAPEEE